MAKARYSSLDIAKGLGIILVVLGHIIPENIWARSIIYSFHMPLFFLISGFFPAKNDEQFFWGYLKRQFKNLYFPYFLVVLFDATIKLIIEVWQGSIEFKSLALSIVLSITGFRMTVYNAPVWFLFSLFIIKCLAYFIQKNRIVEIGFIILSIVFVVLCQKSIINTDIIYHCLYFESISGLIYFLLGKYVFIVFKRISEFNNNYLLYFLAVIMLVLLIPLSKYNGKINVANYIFGNSSLLYFTNSLLGIALVIILSILFDRVEITKRWLMFIGSNSIVFMLFHYYFTNYLWIWFFRYFNIEQLSYNIVIWIIELIVTMLAVIPIVLLVNTKHKKRIKYD